MAPSAFDQQALRPLGEWLEASGPPSAERLQALLRSLAVQLSALHEQSRIHGRLTRDSVQVTSQGEPRLIFDPPGDAPAAFCLDEEACPPELRGQGAIRLTNDLPAASCEFARRGCANDARRIDIFQLAALAIDIATQASVHDYLRRPLVSAQVPAALRGVLDEMLGESTSRSIAHCAQLLAALDAIELASPPADRPSDKISRLTADTAVREAPARRAPRPAAHEPLPFERIGPFEVVARLGSGGMGDVFRGYDRSLDRYVAIKVLPAELARHEDFVTRFRAEAAAAAKVEHPHIVPIYAIGLDGERPYFAMQFVDGPTLAQWLAREPRPDCQTTLRIAEQVVAGLGAAHRQGLVHRDIKPGNILLAEQGTRALLADFGLVKSLRQESGMTATGVVMGTVDYISPEQGRGLPVDGRSDLYSLGVLLFQMLAGRLPFTADTPTAVLFQHAYETPPDLLTVAPRTPPDLAYVVHRLLAKSPDDRYATCEDLLEDLRAVRAGSPLPSRSAAARSSLSGPRTAIIAAPRFDEPPAVELPEVAAAEPTWSWQGIYQRGLIWLGRRAPELVRQLQDTQQQVDGAVFEYEQRCQNLSRLVREAEEVRALLERQLASHQAAAAQARRQEETAEDESERYAAQAAVATNEEAAVEIERQLAQQRDELETIQLQSAKANARLSRLRTQRDALKARLQVARARYDVAEATPRSRRLPRRAVVFLASLLLLIACAAAWRWTRPPASDAPASNATAAISPAANPASDGGTSAKVPDDPNPESAETKPYSLLDLPLDATQRHFTLPVNGTAAQFTEEASGKVAQVVIGGEDGSLFAVQILQGRFESRARRLRGHGSRVNSLAWNPVAHRVASGGDDGQILVWDHPALTLLRRLAQGNRVKGLAFSTNGGQLLSGGQGAARLWDVLSGDPLQNYVEPRAHGNVSAVAWSPDGSGFAIGQNVQGAAAIHVVNLEGTQWRDIPGSAANYLEFLDGGEKLIGVSAKSLAVWNVQDGSTVRSFGDGIACVAFNRHARRAVSGHADGRVILWDTETGQVLHESRMPKRVESISLAKHGEWAVATSGRDVQLFELPLEVVPYRRREFTTTAEIRALAVSPTEFSALSASDQQGELWNLANPQSGRSALTGPGPCNSAAYSPDGNRVLLARAQPDRQGFGPISYVEVPRRGLGSDAILRRYLGHKGGTNAALFVRNGTRVVSGGNDNHVRIWETSTEQELGDFEVEGAVRSLAASPDGKRLALLAGGVEVEIWDLDAKTPAGRLAGHSLAPQVVTWARQASRVATACGDGTARVWDANTLANLATFAHPRGVTAVDLSPDGRWLVTGGQDGRVRIWDVAGQRAGKAWSAHESVVTAVAVAVDGRTFVSAGGDYRLCWWDLPTD